MALDFPNAPALNQTYTGPDGTVWLWDGAKWVPGVQSGAYAPLNSPALTGNPTAPTPSPGDSDTSLATTAFVTAAVAPALTNVGRNLIHNGLFNISQRGGPFTVAFAYTVDRWVSNFTGGDAATVTAPGLSDADRVAIGDENVFRGLQNVVTGTAGATAFTHIAQRIEDVRRLTGKQITVSFWAKANTGTPKLGVSLDQVFGTGGSPSADVLGTGQAVTLTNAFVRYSLSFAMPSFSGKTLGSTVGTDWTQLNFWYSSGANQNVRAGNIGVQSPSIVLWGVQLEIGSVATPLEKPDPQQDLAKCQRFYQVLPGLNFNSYNASGFAFGYGPTLPVAMRAAPTVVISGQTYTNANNLSASAAGLGGQVVSVWAGATVTGQCSFSGTFSLSADL